jgi:cysteine-rich repeat protein
VVSGRSGADAVIIAPAGVSVGSTCPPGKGRLRATKSRTKLTAQLPRCGQRGPAQLTATFQNGCDTLAGSIRLRRGGVRQLVARRQWCGDGTIEPSRLEDCDGSNTGDQTCQSRGYAGGTLRCDANCHFDTSQCTPARVPRCGDGILDPGEQCDGTVQGVTCESLQYAGGTIGCTEDCRFDLSHCVVSTPAACGNGRRDPGEACDGDDLGGAVCPHGGTLRCQPSCLALDTSACLTCGDGRRDPGEACDGADLGGASCQSLGDAGGPLACDALCRFDRTGCFRCGNGRVDPGEECDDGNRTSGDGCSALCVREHTYDGGGNDPNDSCTLDWAVEGSAAGALLTCQDGVPPCDRDAVSGQCTFLVFYCFNASPLVGGTPGCTPPGVARVEVTDDGAAGPAAILAAFTDTLTRLGGASVTPDGAAALDVSPPANTPRICGQFPLTVAASDQRTIGVSVMDAMAPPTVDHDQLTFSCVP